MAPGFPPRSGARVSTSQWRQGFNPRSGARVSTSQWRCRVSTSRGTRVSTSQWRQGSTSEWRHGSTSEWPQGVHLAVAPGFPPRNELWVPTEQFHLQGFLLAVALAFVHAKAKRANVQCSPMMVGLEPVVFHQNTWVHLSQLQYVHIFM